MRKQVFILIIILYFSSFVFADDVFSNESLDPNNIETEATELVEEELETPLNTIITDSEDIVLENDYFTDKDLDDFIKDLLQKEKNKQVLSEDDEKIIYAMLMNQIQYSIANITHYKNKVVLEKEFDNVINRIDKSKLKDPDSVEIFNQILSRISSLKLLENEKEFIIRESEKEKKQAIYKSFNSFGSVFVPGASPQQMIASLAYTGVSAAFNYRNAVNEVENSTSKQLFQISQSTCRGIDNLRIDLFNASTKFINRYEMPKRFEIKEDKMVDLVNLLDGKETNSLINLLETQKEVYALFLPYWYELGSAYQKIGKYDKAKEYYKIFESLKKNYSIIDNDPYYTELAKNMIEILYKEGNFGEIEKYISVIETDENVNNFSSNNYYLAQTYYLLGQKDKAIDKFKLVVDRGEQYSSAARTMCQFLDYTYSEEKKDSVLFEARNFLFEEGRNSISLTIPEIDANHITKIYLQSENLVCDGKLENNKKGMIGVKRYSFKKSGKLLKKENITLVLIVDNSKYEYEYKRYSTNKKDTLAITTALNRIDVTISDFENASLRSFSNYLSSIELLKEKQLKPDSDKKIQKNNRKGIDSRTKDVIEKELGEEAKKINEVWVKAQKEFLNTDEYPYISIIFTTKNRITAYSLVSIKDSINSYSFNKYGCPIKVFNENSSVNTRINQETMASANKGNSKAQFELGTAYILDKNYDEAFKWIEMSANSNNPEALYLLAEMYEQGIGTKKNKKLSKEYYRKASDLGNGAARLKISK